MNKDTAVILVCAGNATRMGGIHKILHPLVETTVLEQSLRTFCKSESVAELIVVCRPQDMDEFRMVTEKMQLSLPLTLTAGGQTRQQSVLNGFAMIKGDAAYAAIHDGARPLVRAQDVEQVIASARIHGGATLGMPVKDTIKVVSDGIITATPDRSTLYLTQTPQVFRRSLYQQAADTAAKAGKDYTDDCQLVEALGVQVAMVCGDYTNIKLTTPEDFAVAEAFLKILADTEEL